jgi:hypothetical protein
MLAQMFQSYSNLVESRIHLRFLGDAERKARKRIESRVIGLPGCQVASSLPFRRRVRRGNIKIVQGGIEGCHQGVNAGFV